MTETSQQQILEALYQVVQQRKGESPEHSYVASLYAKGVDKILGKVGEEATEVVIAGKGGDTGELVYELADLWFHSLVLMAWYDLPPERIFAELSRRFGLSGLAEKANRD